jgi:hypothetical protein
MSRRALIAGTIAATLTVTGLTFAGGGSAGAATLPNSQSVGRFLDGAVGGHPIQQIADIMDARAVNPGTATDQNPLHVKALQAIDLPLTGALQFPELLGVHLGAVNQVAVAKSDGFSYGASGAVNNSGGVSIGGNNNAFPANATIDLDGSSLGAGSGANAIGQAHLNIGAVAALAQTPAGIGQAGTTSYGIGSVDLQAQSPLVAQLLAPVANVLKGVLTTLATGAAALNAPIPPTCPIATGQLPTLNVLGSTITLDPNNGGLTISLDGLLDTLGLNINQLPPNSDLIDLVLNYLTSPNGLAKALATAVGSIGTVLQTAVGACAPAQLSTLLTTTFAGLNQLLSGPLTQLLSSLNGTTSPLAPLGTGLKQLVDIGINVQPNGPAGPFHTALAATPAQGTPVVPGQTIVRAIELQLVGSPPAATIALANAAAGPSNPASVSPTSPAPSTNTQIPTGVPAGFGKPSHGSDLALVLLITGLVLASGGAYAFRLRGRHHA